MRLRATVLAVAALIVAGSIWWQSRQASPETPPAIAQATAQAQTAQAATSAPVSMERAFLAGDPAAIPQVDLSRVDRLDEAAKRLLAAQGLVVVPLGWNSEVASAYGHLKGRREPILVTTDSALHISHLVFDWTLRFLEMAHLYNDLVNLSDALLAQMMAYSEDAPTAEVRAAALDCACYLSIGKRLLAGGDTAGVPKELAGKIAGELRLIENAAGMARSPLFGYREDYSQYKPRGHYSRTEKFQRYFRAMAWYGRMRFLVQPGSRDPQFGGMPEDTVRHQIRQAVLLCRALQEAQVKGEPARRVWERIYETTRLFAGVSDDLTVKEFAGPIASVYGAPPSLRAIADDARLKRFQQEAKELRPPEILSTYSVGTGDDAWREETKGLALFGQRFSLDSSVFQQLTYDSVGFYTGPEPPPPITAVGSPGGVIRGFPLGLDLLSAFGSPEASEIVREGRDDRYQRYAQEMDAARNRLAGVPGEAWVSELYHSRLDAVRRCLADPDDRAPAFMRQKPWLLKQQQTALGTWTELRHDTILYSKQPYAMMQAAMAGATKGGPTPPPPPIVKGYVEPCPEIYRTIEESYERTVTLLKQAGYPEDQALTGSLQHGGQVMGRLADLSEKELTGAELTEEEYKFIEHIGSTYRGMLRFPHHWDVTDPFQTEMDREMPIVADVFTNLDAGQALEEAVGWPMEIAAICPVAGEPTVCRGVTYSYYEFRQPMDNRLTDEQWREMLEQQRAPERPTWTSAFVSEPAQRGGQPVPGG